MSRAHELAIELLIVAGTAACLVLQLRQRGAEKTLSAARNQPVPVNATLNVEGSPSPSGRSTLIRFESPTCVYCGADQRAWEKLKSAAAEAGLRIVLIDPEGYGILESATALSGVSVIRYVRMDEVSKTFSLTGLPTTVIADRSHTLRWVHVGEIMNSDVADARIVLRRVAMRR